MDRSGLVRRLTSPDDLFDLVIVGIVLMAGVLLLLAGGVMFGYLPPG